MAAEQSPSLKRALRLPHATAINMIDMVGIGPFVVMPLVIQTMNGGAAIWAWVFGAIVAFLDGFIWSELGAKFPEAGGSFVFLRKIYPKKIGDALSFLFVWQTTFQAPLVIASGAIGFAQYFSYLVHINEWQQKIVSGSVVVLIVLLLYRDIKSVGRISLWLGIAVVGTLLWIISSGLIFGHEQVHFIPVDENFSFFTIPFFVALGNASVKTVYSYLGYYNVCHLGGEIINPQKNIPRSIFISITGIAVLYLLLCTSVLKTLDINDAKTSQYLFSDFFQQLYGVNTANVATALILIIAFSSLFAVTLGYSRVPYAAAKEGRFFKVFQELHPVKNIPHISLFVLGAFAFFFSLLFKLKDVIQAILAMRILIQFIGQAVGLMLFHYRAKEKMPFRMWLFPIPCILSIIVWIYLFASTEIYALFGAAMIASGLIVYAALFNKREEEN